MTEGVWQVRTFHVETRTWDDLLGHHVELFMVDETGKVIANDRVFDAFYALSAVGYFVKRRSNIPPRLQGPWVEGGPVTRITDEFVMVGDEGIPRSMFHRLYELD